MNHQISDLKLGHSRRERGVALVIVLAFVVLLTGLVVAYFSRSLSDRKLSNSSFNQAKADELARSALDILTGNLKQEIVNGSTSLPNPNPSNSPVVYLSTTNAYMIPVRNGTPALVSGTNTIPTLLRTSSTNAITVPAVDCAASGAISTGTSANGRAISAGRWNKHYLIPLQTPGTPTNTTPIGNFTPPSWVFVTNEKGPAVLSSPTKDTNNNTVTPIGRYAYAIYDEGALLDVNAAGFPRDIGTITMPVQYALKGALAFADLTQLKDSGGSSLITQAGVNNLVGWRNYASMQKLISQPSGTFPTLTFSGATVQDTYKTLVLSNANGFLKVSGTAWGGRTDQPFLTRQELIDLAIATGPANFNPNALQYLGTFSRAVTAPTWRPSADSNTMSGYVGGAGTAAAPYKSNAENSASENRDIPNVRFANAGSITRYADDGSSTPYTVKVGDQLLQHRFSLKRLDWLTATGPAAGKATAIQTSFGLSWDSTNSRWTYNHGSASGILTLDAVSRLNREPDFFELLKAAILDGALGKDPGGQNYPTAEVMGSGGLGVNGPGGQYFGQQGAFLGYSAIPDNQIIQIGANIIDQYDQDSIPTAIYFGASSNPGSFPSYLADMFNTFYGVENLPYIYSMRALRWRDPTTDPPNGQHHGWFQLALWNPHQQTPAGYAGTRPSAFRLRACGESQISDWAGSGTGTLAPTSQRILSYDTPLPAYTGLQYITFTDPGGASSPFYNNPINLSTAQSTSTCAMNIWKSTYGNAVGPFVGFYAGHMKAAETLVSGTHAGWGSGFIIGAHSPVTITIVAEYQDQGGSWHAYDRLARYNAFGGHPWTPESSPAIGVNGNCDLTRADPRTDRFSLSMGWSGIASPANETAATNSYWPNNATQWSRSIQCFAPGTGRGFVNVPAMGNGAGTNWAGRYSVNQIQASGNDAYYPDPDGVIRPGDGYRGNAAGDGRPTYTGGLTDGRRPVILNRPFRSVGELGYVFRDVPFKSLDFLSKDSADAALLDVFCVADEPAIVAGQVNPNNAPAPVLQAILAGASKKETDTTYNISGEAASLSQAIASYITTSGPLANRADLVIATSGAANLSSAINAAFSAAPDKANKAYCEAPLRALADVTNTRTWNLLIDVIAQTGAFSPSAPANQAALNSSFNVQGERRYWLHIAIDRFTGKVIDQQLEAVYE